MTKVSDPLVVFSKIFKTEYESVLREWRLYRTAFTKTVQYSGMTITFTVSEDSITTTFTVHRMQAGRLINVTAAIMVHSLETGDVRVTNEDILKQHIRRAAAIARTS
jgi:hypothetical protein